MLTSECSGSIAKKKYMYRSIYIIYIMTPSAECYVCRKDIGNSLILMYVKLSGFMFDVKLNYQNNTCILVPCTFQNFKLFN